MSQEGFGPLKVGRRVVAECGRERRGEPSTQQPQEPIKPHPLLSPVSLCFLQLIEEDGSRPISAASWGRKGVKVFS